MIYCGSLEACHELVDLRRAQEWTEAMRVEHGRVAEIWGAGTPARPS